jgi:hypothetical protein
MEEHRLRAFESRMMRRIYVPKKKEVTRHLRRYNETLFSNSSPNIIRVIKSRRRYETWGIHG